MAKIVLLSMGVFYIIVSFWYSSRVVCDTQAFGITHLRPLPRWIETPIPARRLLIGRTQTEGINEMRSIAFFNNKGGVGKTTLLCNVAALLAIEKGKKILVVDADPQCNATQLMLDELKVFTLYDNQKSFTIHSIIHPLSIGKGYSETLEPIAVTDYSVDLIPGDPRLALKEDLLSKDWQDAIAGDIRGLRTSLSKLRLCAFRHGPFSWIHK
jgi:hypothetical protein